MQTTAKSSGVSLRERRALERLRRTSPEGMPEPRRSRSRRTVMVIGLCVGLAMIALGLGIVVFGTEAAIGGVVLGAGLLLVGAAPAWLAGVYRRAEHERAERSVGVDQD